MNGTAQAAGPATWAVLFSKNIETLLPKILICNGLCGCAQMRVLSKRGHNACKPGLHYKLPNSRKQNSNQ
jgi:hypothetical protein